MGAKGDALQGSVSVGGNGRDIGLGLGLGLKFRGGVRVSFLECRETRLMSRRACDQRSVLPEIVQRIGMLEHVSVDVQLVVHITRLHVLLSSSLLRTCCLEHARPAVLRE